MARSTPYAQVIGQNIERWRNHRGWTQQQLADRMGFSRSHVGRLESFQEARASDLVAVAKALDCAVFDLLLPLDDRGRVTDVRVDGAGVVDAEALLDLLLLTRTARPDETNIFDALPKGSRAQVRRWVERPDEWVREFGYTTDRLEFLGALADQLSEAAQAVRESKWRMDQYDAGFDAYTSDMGAEYIQEAAEMGLSDDEE